MKRDHIETILKQQKTFLKEQYYVNKIGVFGSYAREEQTDESDIDILVEFNRPVGFEFIELKYHLESVFNKQVDLVTINGLKPSMKEDILNEVLFQ